MKHSLTAWFASLQGRQGADILAVQTLRNALMAASVLASAALVGLMGVLATAHLHALWSASSAAVLLVVSAACALRALWTLSALGFDLQLQANAVVLQADAAASMPSDTASQSVVQAIAMALQGIRWSGILMILGLAAAAAGLLARA